MSIKLTVKKLAIAGALVLAGVAAAVAATQNTAFSCSFSDRCDD